MKCDHIIGYSAGIEGGWLTKWSKSGQDLNDLETRFKFCPECGENIENLKLKRRYRHPKWNAGVTKHMANLNDDIMAKMIKKVSDGHSMIQLLTSGSFEREIGTLTKERE